MRGHFLTQVFNPFLLKFGYFNTTNNLTLKRFLIFAALIIPSFASIAQSYNNIEFSIHIPPLVALDILSVAAAGFIGVKHSDCR